MRRELTKGSMVASYAVGLRLSVSPFSFTKRLGHEDINVNDSLIGLATAHFAASVAVSGCLCPRMFIHLMKARDDQLFTSSRDLSSLQFASFAGLEVSLLLYHYARLLY